MRPGHINRRAILAAAAASTTAGMLGGRAMAQGSAVMPMRGEFVVRGAHVLTMDANLADLPAGDVHVRDGAIVAVGATLPAPNVEAIDGRGMICMPGFVDTHWHLWTSALRPVMRQDDPARGYFPVTSRLGPHYEPIDSYRNVRIGLAEALSAGVTTVQNWAHNVRSPAHADAEMRAMRDTGIRGRFAYGCGQGIPNDQPMDLSDLPAPSANGRAAMACSRWASARVTSAPIPIHNAAT